MTTGYASTVGYACALGTWRSLVAHLLWEQGVAGSNPAVPTQIWGILAPALQPLCNPAAREARMRRDFHPAND
jgi:hypothetical protein